jgi:hypothetical protein
MYDVIEFTFYMLESKEMEEHELRVSNSHHQKDEWEETK